MRSLCICLVSLLLSLDCTSGTQPSGVNQGQTLREDVREIKSVLMAEKTSSWRVNARVLNGKETLNCVYFLNESDGWIGGNSSLYKTSDRGKSWERVIIGPAQTKVDDIFFQD